MITVDVIIPTYKLGSSFRDLLNQLSLQTILPNKLIIINTEEQYFKESLFQGITTFEIVVQHITKKDFDHGLTRNLGASLSNADKILFMTQDAIPENTKLIENLCKGFSMGENVAAVYARQMARKDCSLGEYFSREFNYPCMPLLKSKKDKENLGIKTIFCSNVCAMYDKKIFDKLGGFKKAIFNEDMVFADRLIEEGYSIYYQSEARVIHSHNYSMEEYYRRSFDIGVSQSMNEGVFSKYSSEKEGVKLVLKAILYFTKKLRPLYSIKYSLASFFRYLGFKKGKKYKELSQEEILKCTLNKEFWIKE